MTNVMLPKYVPCTKQPQGPVEVDWNNPITRNLTMYYIPSFMEKPSSATIKLSGPGKVPLLISKDGIARSEQQMGSTYRHNSKFNSNSITIVAIIRRNTLSGSDSVGSYIAGFSTDGWDVSYSLGLTYKGFNNREVIEFVSRLPFQGVTSCTYNFAGVSHPNPCVLVARRWFNTDSSLWIAGNKVADGGPTTSTLAPLNGADCFIYDGQQRGSFDSGQNGLLYGWVVFDRPLSDEEIRSISANPWQLFHQRVQSPQNITTKENRKPIIRESNMLGTSKRKLSDVNLLEVLRKPMMNQPQSRLQIDWSNPITRGLTLLLSPNWGPGNHLSAGNYVVLDNKPMSSCKLGYGITNISTSGGLYTNRTSTLGEISRLEALFAGPHTLVGIADLRGDSGNTKGIFATNFANGAIQAFGFSQDSFENRMRVVVGGIITSITAITPSDMASHPVWVVAVGAPTNGGSIRIRVGNKIASATISGTPSVSSGATVSAHQFFSEATGNGSSTTTMLGTYVAQLAWNRALSDAEVLSISNNPWQIFRQSSNLPLLK